MKSKSISSDNNQLPVFQQIQQHDEWNRTSKKEVKALLIGCTIYRKPDPNTTTAAINLQTGAFTVYEKLIAGRVTNSEDRDQLKNTIKAQIVMVFSRFTYLVKEKWFDSLSSFIHQVFAHDIAQRNRIINAIGKNIHIPIDANFVIKPIFDKDSFSVPYPQFQEAHQICKQALLNKVAQTVDEMSKWFEEHCILAQTIEQFEWEGRKSAISRELPNRIEDEHGNKI